jgi:CBS domain-containing protein
MLKLPRVRDHMDQSVPSLPPDASALAAVEFLLVHRVTGAPVIDENGQLVGIITEWDLLKLAATQGAKGAVGLIVQDLMTTDVITVPSRMDIYYAAGIFLKQNFRRLIVVDNEKVVGAITRYDILRAVHQNRDKFQD